MSTLEKKEKVNKDPIKKVNETIIKEKAEKAEKDRFQEIVEKARNNEIVSIHKDLAIAQSSFDKITKNLKVYTKAGTLMYSYADLNTIINEVTPILFENNLCFRFEIYQDENGVEFLKGILNHFISDEKIESMINIDNNISQSSNLGLIQQKGAALTFLKRYLMVLMLNLALDQDDDGVAAKEAEIKTNGGERAASEGQIKFLKSLLAKCNVTEQQFLDKNNITDISKTPISLASSKIAALKNHLGMS